ncbi:hypothetical protein [Streptomyces sp. NPDC057253]|uniref:hypothetical protein n=1 Tax=Streptomyces sp. NPDC057253 TaxID=3346069 RepID=UPI003628104E
MPNSVSEETFIAAVALTSARTGAAWRTRGARGDGRVGDWRYDDPALDHLGCDRRPSARDHRRPVFS